MDLLAVQQKALRTGLAPQELFFFESEGRRVRVWLQGDRG